MTVLKCALLLLCGCREIVSANKYTSLIEEGKEPWISLPDYRIALKASFPFARCCNVFVNGTTTEVERSFEYFVKSYANDYAVMRRIHQCQGYLVIGHEEKSLRWALNKVPSLISTTELLIIFAGDLPDDSVLLNGSLYRNANANLISLGGKWSLSENFLEPRVFERVARYEDLSYKNGLADFKGRELRAAAYYNPPMCYLNKTVNKTVGGVQAEIFLADDELERDGFEFKIFTLIAERLNFSWTVRHPSGRFRYGRRGANDTWHGGMIGQLINEEIDIAFSGIWLKEDHNLFTNLSFPFGELAIKFLVPRPKAYASIWALTRPFSPPVWALIVLAGTCQTCYMAIRARLKPAKSTRRFGSLANAGIELTARFLGISMQRNIEGAKFQLLFWQAAGLVMVTAYCSSLAARLAGAEYGDRIDSVRQLLDAGFTWGRQGADPIFADYFDLENEYSSMLPKRYNRERSDEDRRRSIAKGNYAIIGRLVGGVFFPEGNVSNNDLRNYRVMRESVGSYYSCFAMQPWLLGKIDKMMLRSFEAGFATFHLEDVIRRRAGSSLREVLIERDKSDGTAIILPLTPLASGFMLLFAGLTISLLVFFHELKSGNHGMKIDEIIGQVNMAGRKLPKFRKN